MRDAIREAISGNQRPSVTIIGRVRTERVVMLLSEPMVLHDRLPIARVARRRLKACPPTSASRSSRLSCAARATSNAALAAEALP